MKEINEPSDLKISALLAALGAIIYVILQRSL